jgi:hypothetical protein
MKTQKLTQKIIEKIKASKKYSSISDEILITEIEKYLKSNPEIEKTEKITKQDIKNIRAKLHKLYSSYQTKKKKKQDVYLEELDTNKLLSITISTKERIKDYKWIYKKIFRITGKPKTIIDLGSGLNPLSFPLMDLESVNYFSYDVDEKDIEFLNKYFKVMKNKGLNGKASFIDVRNTEKIKQLPKSDIVFLFKVIDIIDIKNHKSSEELIKQLIKKTNYIVASFATKTITRKQMNFPNRKWFELMLKRLNLKFKTIKTDNEIYYVAFE